MSDEIVIIGGGVGGLFTGALLAVNGLRVTVLEKNHIIGGGLQCFGRDGHIFETGMHVLGGFGPDGTVSRICDYLGIRDRLSLQHISPECMDEITIGSGDRYRIPSGRERFTAYFCDRFPAETDGIRRYVDAMYRLADEVPLFSLRESEGITVHTDEFTMAADAFIARYVTDPHLRDLLAYLNPLYGGRRGMTPAYVHALINILYISGASRFVGGSQQLADALADVIRSHNGRVLADSEVTHVCVEAKQVRYIGTADGSRHIADRYIWAAHPCGLLRAASPGTFVRGYVRRLESIPLSYSAFTLFISLKPDRLPYIDHTCYYVDRYSDIWDQDIADDDTWPHGFMYMTPPDPDRGRYASRMLVHCVMGFDAVRRWEDTTVGRRGEDYRKWKAAHVSRVMDRLSRALPGLVDAVDKIYAASPLTIRDYYHTKDGAIFGYAKDCNNMMLSQLPVYTKVPNLLLTGQNVNLHGICGVPLTAIQTAEAILGPGTLLRAITNNHKIRLQ